MVERIRDPMASVWPVLDQRLRAMAKAMRAQAPHDQVYGADDLAQTTLQKTQAFVARRREEEGAGSTVTEAFLKECLSHAYICMEHAHIDELRKAKRRPRHFINVVERDSKGELVIDIRDTRASADERAIARSFVATMRGRSKGAAIHRMLAVLDGLIDDGLPSVSLRDIGDAARASDNDIYKFRKLAKLVRDEITPEGQAL